MSLTCTVGLNDWLYLLLLYIDSPIGIGPLQRRVCLQFTWRPPALYAANPEFELLELPMMCVGEEGHL